MPKVTARGLPQIETDQTQEQPYRRIEAHEEIVKAHEEIVVHEESVTPLLSPADQAEFDHILKEATVAEVAAGDLHAPGEACAEHIMKYIQSDPAWATKIEADLQESGVSLFAMTIAYLRACHSTPASRIARQFLDEAAIQTKAGPGPRVARCEGCPATFTHTRIGQRFCCNACGSRHNGTHTVRPHSEDCPVYGHLMQQPIQQQVA